MRQSLSFFFTAVLLLIIASVSGQSKEVTFIIDTSIKIMKENAANADKVDWDKLHTAALANAAGIDDAHKLGPVMRNLYQSINDFHGSFFYKDSTFKWIHNEPVISDSIMNEWKKGVSITTLMLENKIGYLRIPSMPFSGKKDADQKAQALNDSLCSLLNKNMKALILDLRLDGGGAMYPMILGVQQLLEPGQLGSFITKKREYWYVKNNNFLIDTAILTSIIPKCSISAQNIPVVILTGPGTGSSGEFFVIAFKTRKKTILLGTSTAGYVTSVAGFPINAAAYMYLSTGYGADKNSKVYKESLIPDIQIISADKFNDLNNDEKVKAAINWLKLHVTN